MKEEINGWIVVTDFGKKAKTVPVDQKFFMAKACAVCKRDEMELKRKIDPDTYRYPYVIKHATLIVEK